MTEFCKFNTRISVYITQQLLLSHRLVKFDADGPVFADVFEYSDPLDGAELGPVVRHPHDPFADR